MTSTEIQTLVLLWHSAEHIACHPDRREGTEDFLTQ